MLGYILVAGALAMGLAAGKDLPQIAGYFVEGLLAWNTIQLLGMVTLIEMLTELLQFTGSLQRVLAALRRVVDDSRVLIALVPSLMGLMPVPGGAILSAPMVGTYGDEIGFDADGKSAVNLFFRHIWNMVFPFKQHLILTSMVLNIPLFTLISWQLPVTLVSLLAGFWLLVGRSAVPGAGRRLAEVDLGNGPPLWVEVAPILMPLVLALAFGVELLHAMSAGLLFGLATHRVSRGLLEKMVVKGVRPRLLFILASVMIFKTVLDHTGMMTGIAIALTDHGVPIGALIIALPMIVSAATGMEVAAVGMVFPLLVGLVPEGTPVMPYILMMMLAGDIAQTLSPVHVCLVVGNEYYGASFKRVLRISLPPQAFRFALGLAFAWAVATYWPQ